MLSLAVGALCQRPYSRHLIEQPAEGICSFGPRPVSAICFIAS
jgi:hypothetical protein